MSDTFFPDPQQDESAEDPFVSPNDQEISAGTLGASPTVVPAVRGNRKRTAIIMIGGAIGALALFFIISARSGSSPTPATSQNGTAGRAYQGSIDTLTRAPMETLNATPPAPLTDGETITPPPGTGPSVSEVNRLLDPNRPVDVTPQPSGDQPGAPGQPYAPTGMPTLPGATPGAPVGAYPPGGMPGTAVPNGIPGALPAGPGGPSYTPTGTPGPFPTGPQRDSGEAQGLGPLSPSDLERQARLDAQREAEQRRQAELEKQREAQKAEEERLRNGGTLLVDAGLLGQGTSAGVPPGTSRFAGSAASPNALPDSANAGAPESVMTGTPVTPAATDTFDIIPGTRVTAILMSEFISDAEGGGQVEARLTQPLRSRGKTLLPAGTRAFGMASATVPGPGQPARVQLTFNVFVTPNGQVIRDGLTGKAADPQTLAMSIPGKVDQRYAERILRGALTTTIDLMLTKDQTEQQVCSAVTGACTEPSPKQQALNDARGRLGALINGPIGDEQSVRPAVTLPQHTQFVMIFGL